MRLYTKNVGPNHTHELSDTEIMRGAYGEAATGVRIEPFAGEPLVDYNRVYSWLVYDIKTVKDRSCQGHIHRSFVGLIGRL